MTSASDREHAQLEKALERARTGLRASIQGLTDEQLTRPGAVGE